MTPSIAEATAALEAFLEATSTPEAEALAGDLAVRLYAVRREDPVPQRQEAVRGLLAVNHQFYRTGDLRRCGEALRCALALAHDLDAGLRVSVLLRCGDFDMLRWDVAAALRHTNEAMELAHGSGRRVEEARALINFGMALDFAGLYDEADRN